MSSILRVSRQMVIPSGFMEVRAPKTAPVAAWWVVPGKTCVAAYQPKGAASLAASYINLANPGTYNAALGIAPDWDDTNGWKFNGTNQYLMLPSYTFVPSTHALFVRFADALNEIRCVTGTTSGGTYRRMELWPSNGTTSRFAEGNSVISGPVPYAAGIMGISDKTGYYNGASVGNILDTESWTTTYTLAIGARNRGIIEYYYKGSIQAWALYSDLLTAGEVATLSAAMAAL